MRFLAWESSKSFTRVAIIITSLGMYIVYIYIYMYFFYLWIMCTYVHVYACMYKEGERGTKRCAGEDPRQLMHAACMARACPKPGGGPPVRIPLKIL